MSFNPQYGYGNKNEKSNTFGKKVSIPNMGMVTKGGQENDLRTEVSIPNMGTVTTLRRKQVRVGIKFQSPIWVR